VAALISRLRDEHDNQRTRLAILHSLLTQPGPAPEEHIAVQVRHLLQDLRLHMAAEEIWLFPCLDHEVDLIVVREEAAPLAGVP
jgi:hypothetical protein